MHLTLPLTSLHIDSVTLDCSHGCFMTITTLCVVGTNLVSLLQSHCISGHRLILSATLSSPPRCTGDRGRAGAPIPAPAWALARHRVGQLWAHLNMTALALNATASSPGTDASPAPAADDEARRLMSGRALVDSMPEGQSAGDNIRVTTAGSRSDIGISGAGSSLTIRRHLSETTSNSSSHSNHSSAEPPGTSPAAAPSMPLVTKELRSALPDLGCLPPAGEFAGIGSEDKPPQIPAWEVSHFPAVHAVIQRAYEIYEEVASRPPFSSTSKNG
jgi:hypothetical protein